MNFPAHGRVGKFRCGPTRLSIHETLHKKKFRTDSLYVGTLRGRSSEVVETMSRRSVTCCLQEIRWRGASARMIEGKDSCYQISWVGNENDTDGVGILLSRKWIEKVFDFNRVMDRIMIIKLPIDNKIVTAAIDNKIITVAIDNKIITVAIDNKIITVLSCYTPQVGLDNIVKDTFYDQLQDTVRKVGADETLVICGDLNGHFGKLANGYEGVGGA